MKLHVLTLAIGLVLSVSVSAQEPDASLESDRKVEVSGVKNPALRPYRIMSRGLDAFDKHHALAPQADLRFELWDQDGTVPSTAGLTLRLAGDAVDLPLPVDADATFVLPRSQEAFDGNADLILNRRKEQMRWRPRVRSPDVPANARRLGDLRLECEVSWAVTKDDLSFLARTAVGAAGGFCRAPLVTMRYRAPQRLAAVNVISGERTAPLALMEGGRSFVVPLRDKSWDDDSLIVYQFADGATPAPQKEEGAAAP